MAYWGWENQMETGCLLKKMEMPPTYTANEFAQVYHFLLRSPRASDSQTTQCPTSDPITLQYWHCRPAHTLGSREKPSLLGSSGVPIAYNASTLLLPFCRHALQNPAPSWHEN